MGDTQPQSTPASGRPPEGRTLAGHDRISLPQRVGPAPVLPAATPPRELAVDNPSGIPGRPAPEWSIPAAGTPAADKSPREPSIRARPYRPAAEPEAERRVRGPRHRRPVLLRFTAILHLVTRLAFLLTVIGLPVIVLINPLWFKPALCIPGLWLVSGVIWLMAASRIGCRVCGMRMFYNKQCVKSVKAPAWPGLGPHTTMAALSLCSKAVRCPYCGTPNELGDRRDG